MPGDFLFGVCVGVFMGFWIGILFALWLMPRRWFT